MPWTRLGAPRAVSNHVYHTGDTGLPQGGRSAMRSDRKKVLFVVPAFVGGIGGPERVFTTLLRHIDHSRFECHLALVRSGTEFLEDVPPCVTVHHLRVSRMRYSLPAIITLARRLRQI